MSDEIEVKSLLFQSTTKADFVGIGIKPIIWRWTCGGGILGWILRTIPSLGGFQA